ncbi:hypothetical protein [Pseudoalteromonas xiamenensis]
MLKIRFSKSYAVSNSPAVIRFGGVTQPAENKELIIECQSAWSSPFVNTSETCLKFSKRADVSVEYSQCFSVGMFYVNEIGVSFTQNLACASEHITAWKVSPAPTMSFYNVAWAHDKIAELRARIIWPTFSELVTRNILIYYGPTAAEYYCVWTSHPAPGKVRVRFKGQLAGQTGKLKLRFKMPDKICWWGLPGDPVRSDDDIPAIDSKIPIEPQIQRAYIMQPTLACKRLSDSLDILISSVSYSISRSQFAATGTIKFCSRIDMERAIGQELQLLINGYEFVVICEEPATNSSFANHSFSAAIRGRFALLSEPFARTTNYSNPTALTIAGVMAEVVKNTGWTINNKMIDYPVPVGAFSYRNLTPAAALLKVAKSIGAILDIDTVTKVISVVPEWPVNPWATDSATCDVILNDSLILEHNTRQITSPTHTAVFVRGEQQGVACKITRSGTTGSDYASDVVDSLITDVQAARQRGTAELAKSGNKQETTIRTKLLDSLPPIRPGMLVGIRYKDSLFKATCDQLSINASINSSGAITINQTVKVLSNV